jgi:hypothetical protein
LIQRIMGILKILLTFLPTNIKVKEVLDRNLMCIKHCYHALIEGNIEEKDLEKNTLKMCLNK